VGTAPLYNLQFVSYHDISMSPERITTLAEQLAEITGTTPEDVRSALESGDPAMERLAESLIELDKSRPEWHADMRRHRRRILAAA